MEVDNTSCNEIKIRRAQLVELFHKPIYVLDLDLGTLQVMFGDYPNYLRATRNKSKHNLRLKCCQKTV